MEDISKSRLALRTRRKDLGLTCHDAASALNTTASTVSNMENSRHPSTSYFYRQYIELLTSRERRRLRELSKQHPDELTSIVSELLNRPNQTEEPRSA